MKNNTLTIVLIGTSLALGSLSALAQTASTGTTTTGSTTSVGSPAVPVGKNPTPAATSSTAEQEAPIYVTGSAIPTTDTEGASPVVVVDAAAIQKRGYQTVEDVIKNMPANGSFSSPGQTSNNFAAGGAYASLRGLGPQATLVLINGRRVANYAAAANGQFPFVDLNNIPAQIVDRVEVLTEGTAIYGADAVAGVINIITKKNLGDENGEVDTYIGNTDSKDAFEQRYTIMGNLGSFDKNGFGVAEIDYEHQNSIFAGDREISKTADQSGNGGANLESGRVYPGLFLGETTGDEFSILPGTPNIPLTGAAEANDNANSAFIPYDYNPPTSIIPETTHYGAYMNYTYKFYDGNVTPNIDFTYRHNRTVLQSAPAGYSFFDGDTGPSELSPALGAPGFQIPVTNPYNQTGEVIDILSYRVVPVGPRIEDVDNDVFRIVPSVDVKLGDGWTLNAGFNYSYSFVNDRGQNFISASGFQNALNRTTLATAYNPFTSVGQQTPGALDGIFGQEQNRDVSSLLAEDFRINGKLFDLPAGPVQIALGGEYRTERYTTKYSQDDLDGNILATSVQLDTAASQRDLSGYTEIDIPLTSPSFNIPGFYSVDAQVAGRVDKYSVFGTTQNPQVRLRWEVVPGLIVRGGYSTEFRAPSLVEQAAGGNQAFETVFDPLANPGSAAAAPEVLINSPGNPDLKPETAETFEGGVAYTPDFIKGLLVTADYFHIRYSDMIQQTSAQELINENSPLVTRGPPNTNNPAGNITAVDATYINLPGSSTTDGIDMGFQYVIGDPNANYGQFTLAVNGTLYLDNLTNSTDPVTGKNVVTENIGKDSGGVGPYSRYRQDSSLTWDFHNFEYVLSNDFASGYRDTNGLDPNFFPIERGVANYTTFNMQASYEFDKEEIAKWAPSPKGDGFDWQNIVAGTKLTIGVNNVWDTQPPFTANTSDTLGYDPDYADPTGRFIYGEISKKF